MQEPVYSGDPDLNDRFIREPIPADAPAPPVTWSAARSRDPLGTGARVLICLGLSGFVICLVAAVLR